MLSVAVVAIVLAAIFVMPSQRIFSTRIPAVVQSRDYTHISEELIMNNRGLRTALECADSHYEILKRTGSQTQNPISADPSCETKISAYDASMIKSQIPVFSLDGHYLYQVEHEGKYHTILMLPE
ncbi:hypothetical protein NTE_00072 [Candidatus Nitrososphaera evergladensis SR1]|uniref:Uncharacterized protein n=1 Tax=Candidatus Nitrososphaera evergladensis SR1 TaxID=1459636 RepID=A0A075ML50_9ARCH|nr:hypothetical protein NTE_00072 [Candidatus Nitrososphaera evergladensis SR1]